MESLFRGPQQQLIRQLMEMNVGVPTPARPPDPPKHLSFVVAFVDTSPYSNYNDFKVMVVPACAK